MTKTGIPLVLAFGNKARQGKDEAAKTIIRERGNDLNIVAISFADALRAEVTDAMNLLVEIGFARSSWRRFGWKLKRLTAEQDALYQLCHLWKTTFDPLAVADPVYPHGKQRRLLQAVGQGKRDDDPDYWLKRWHEAVAASDADVVLCTDMRYPNEMSAVEELGGYTVRFTRRGYQGLSAEAAAHISETALDHSIFHHYITVDDGQVELLRETALGLFDELIQKEGL